MYKRPVSVLIHQPRTVSAVGASDAADCPRVYLVDLKKKKLAIGSEVTVHNYDLYLMCMCNIVLFFTILLPFAFEQELNYWCMKLATVPEYTG